LSRRVELRETAGADFRDFGIAVYAPDLSAVPTEQELAHVIS
jgi:hypothetical protein